MKMEKISEMNDALYLKRNDESLYLAILVSLNSMAEIKSQEKPSSLKKSHQVAELTDRLGRWSSEFPRQVECAKPQNEMERRSRTVDQLGMLTQDKILLGSKVVRKVRKQNQGSWLLRPNCSALQNWTTRPRKFCRKVRGICVKTKG